MLLNYFTASKCITKWKTIKHQFVKARKDGNTAWELWSLLKFLDEAANRKYVSHCQTHCQTHCTYMRERESVCIYVVRLIAYFIEQANDTQ